MPATVTVTGTAGAGLTVAAAVFSDVNDFLVETAKSIITLFRSNGTVTQVSITAATTVTATKSGTTWTLTIS